jgi:pimeloyl-ACP methyl ester carboxylesterase
MERLTTPAGITVSFDRGGSGAPLVLSHGAFSDHHTNWEFVKPSLRKDFTVYAVARRGRGETDRTQVGEPVFLAGHSYGAHCALGAAHRLPGRVRKLVLYEPGHPNLVPSAVLARLEDLATAGDWDELAFTFFRDALHVPVHELEAVRASELWAPIVADAPASIHDITALTKYDFDAARYRDLDMQVLLQTGSESPRDLYVTDALAAALPHASIGVLAGQAHEGMTTAPDMYLEAVRLFLLDSAPILERARTGAAAVR